MKRLMEKRIGLLYLIGLFWSNCIIVYGQPTFSTDRVEWKGASYLVTKVDARQVEFFLKSEDGQQIGSFSNLKKHVHQQGKELLFAMNGGMYLPHKKNEPQGLYIEQGETIKELDREYTHRPIKTNFYLHPNGVFYIKNNGEAFIQDNKSFQSIYNEGTCDGIKYATQSGPMLIINGKIHPSFTPNSKNIHVRNAVGILPDGNVCLVLSEEKICFYDLATLFRDQLNCEHALYLDGYVSRMYHASLEQCPLYQKENFGVIIGVTEIK